MAANRWYNLGENTRYILGAKTWYNFGENCWYILTRKMTEACFLSGYDRLTMFAIIEEDGVDLNTEGLIEKRSLLEWQEVTVELAHWDD